MSKKPDFPSLISQWLRKRADKEGFDTSQELVHTGVTEPGGEALKTFHPAGQPTLEQQKTPLSNTMASRRVWHQRPLDSGPGIWMGPKGKAPVGSRDFYRLGGTEPNEEWSRYPASYPVFTRFKKPLVIDSYEKKDKWKQALIPYSERGTNLLHGPDTGFRPDFPYRFDWKQKKQLENLGYDSIILKLPDSDPEYVAFYSDQVKSVYDFMPEDVKKIKGKEILTTAALLPTAAWLRYGAQPNIPEPEDELTPLPDVGAVAPAAAYDVLPHFRSPDLPRKPIEAVAPLSDALRGIEEFGQGWIPFVGPLREITDRLRFGEPLGFGSALELAADR